MGKDTRSPLNSGTTSVLVENVAESIVLLRGQRVILDRELATIYGVETRALNQSVKRNLHVFRWISCSRSRARKPSFKITNCDLKIGRGRHMKSFRTPSPNTAHPGSQCSELTADGE